jgi:hypothetical protein
MIGRRDFLKQSCFSTELFAAGLKKLANLPVMVEYLFAGEQPGAESVQ